MRKLAVSLCVLISLNALTAKNRKDFPAAPLPAVVVNAKKIFLTNGGGSNLAYDSFYSEMKQWGRYESLAHRMRLMSSLNSLTGLNVAGPTFGVQPILRRDHPGS